MLVGQAPSVVLVVQVQSATSQKQVFRGWLAWWPGKWVARHGWGLGGLWWLGARRGQRLVPLHAIPRRGAGGGLEAGPRGNCVAVMPCGA